MDEDSSDMWTPPMMSIAYSKLNKQVTEKASKIINGDELLKHCNWLVSDKNDNVRPRGVKN